MQGHGALGGVENEQFRPAQAEQRHLVGDLEFREKWDVPGPLYGREEQPGSELADVLDAHDVGLLHAVAEPRRGVGLGSQEHGDEAGQVGVAVQGVTVVEGHLSVKRMLGGWDTPALDS